MSADQPTDEELIAHGLYEPSGPDAAARRELIDYLVSIGATLDDLIAYRDEMPSLGTVVTARPGQPRYTAEEVSERTGISDEDGRRLWRAAGFPEVEPGAVVFSDQDVEVLQLIAAARALFGEEAVLQLTRVIGSSLARIADAVVSSFLVNIEVPIVANEPQNIAIAQANYAAASLLPGLSRAMDVMLRHHILAARRSLLAWQETGVTGYEVQHLAVGFIDLVGWTELAQDVTAGELGKVLTDFEAIVSDEVISRRGRVVKLIGDEAMFVTPDIESACDAALAVLGQLENSPSLPIARAGFAAGDILSRDGDYFGPVVNLAARIVSVAGQAEAWLPADHREALERAGFRVRSVGDHALKGIDGPVELLAAER